MGDKVLLEEYLQDPCGKLSLPYWKWQTVVIPNGMKIVHDRDFISRDHVGYEDERFFRLCHRLKNIPSVCLDGYSISTMIRDDIPAAVEVINSSYEDIKVTAEQMEGYTTTKVYDAALWVAVAEKASGSMVGCGIADHDREAGEIVLEWVQVLPQYRRRGIGRLIVAEILRRGRNEAAFATVSGKVDNPTSPEALYRKCGFTGDDVWHILTLKG